MFRTVADQVSLWEAVLPAELLRFPAELARVDELLDDEAFFGPFEEFFDPRIGRPSTPMEVYLRLMFLKFRYRLGYETLCREVGDSFTWRRFHPAEGHLRQLTQLGLTRDRRAASAALPDRLDDVVPRVPDALTDRGGRRFHRGRGRPQRRQADHPAVAGAVGEDLLRCRRPGAWSAPSLSMADDRSAAAAPTPTSSWPAAWNSTVRTFGCFRTDCRP